MPEPLGLPDPELEGLEPERELVAEPLLPLPLPLPLAPDPLALAGAPMTAVVELAAVTVKVAVWLVPGMPWVRVWMPVVPTAGMVM